MAIVEELLTERGIDLANYPSTIPYKGPNDIWIIWERGKEFSYGGPRAAAEEEVLKHQLCIKS